MSEKCPLISRRWLSDPNFPDVCREQCGELWEEAQDTQAGEIDDFTDSIQNECAHMATEYLDSEVKRAGGDADASRAISVNSSCIGCGEETDSFTYVFACPYN